MLTSSIVVAELGDKYRREKIDADMAGELKQELREHHKDAGLADAIIFAYACSVNGKMLTGDKHLKHCKNAIDITRR